MLIEILIAARVKQAARSLKTIENGRDYYDDFADMFFDWIERKTARRLAQQEVNEFKQHKRFPSGQHQKRKSKSRPGVEED